MFNWLIRKVNYLKILKSTSSSPDNNQEKEPISDSIELVNKKLRDTFVNCSDFVLREIKLGQPTKLTISLAFIDGLISKQTVNDDILKPLMSSDHNWNIVDINKSTALSYLKNHILHTAQLEELSDFNEVIQAMLSGNTLIFCENNTIALKAGTSGWESRTVDEPETEAVVRGPREGFVESLGVNISMIRRKIKNPNLKIENLTLGKQTKTNVSFLYIEGIANPEIISTVKDRLNSITLDAILESGYIEEFIEDGKLSLFPTVGNSEKPDIIASKLLEGRVAIVCDGTPFVLTVPFLFIESIQASEDYYSRPFYSSVLRFLRLLALFISMTGPAFYVSLLTFHQSIIPFELIITIAAGRAGIPFSPFSEALFMGLAFEILREAGVRMPRPIGQAVSIVGALVIGEASVRAGLVSNPMVIVTAFTAITSFINAPMSGVMPILRFTLLGIANVLGLLGIVFMLIFLVIHLSSLRSFGVPYTAPLAPLAGMNLKDTLLRMPHWLKPSK